MTVTSRRGSYFPRSPRSRQRPSERYTDNQEPYLDESASDTDFKSKGVLNSSLNMADKLTLNADSSLKAITSISDTSATQHLPCTYHSEGAGPTERFHKTELSSDFSSRHFLKRDFASSVEQIIFEFFLSLGQSKENALAYAEKTVLSSPTPPTPKPSPSLPQPSQESPSNLNARGRLREV
jgi:hypothetical protein